VTVKKTMPLVGGRSFHLVIGDLLDQPVDAIVNAANGGLSHGGGVAGAISRAAGPGLDAESRAHVAKHGRVPTGEAAVTGAGRLEYRGVIHAVGPVMGDGDEEAKLASAIASSLLRAHERGWRSVAFPAVSSGIFAVPLDVCARAYVAGVRRHFAEHPDSTLREARLVVFEGPIVEKMVAEMERMR
jgi:putative ATPase